MFHRRFVQEALKRTWEMDTISGWDSKSPVDGDDSVISLLIHDFFGGEILKTPKKRGWHFYNRIDGERVDFADPFAGKLSEETNFEDIPSSPVETYNYFEQVDYSTLFMRFIWAFEESVGLDNHEPGLAF